MSIPNFIKIRRFDKEVCARQMQGSHSHESSTTHWSTWLNDEPLWRRWVMLGSKFGRYIFCHDVAGGLSPFLSNKFWPIPQTVCDRFLSHVSQSHCLVIILIYFAVQLLRKAITLTVERTQHYKTCIRHLNTNVKFSL
jgi:hypothetical protein